MKHLHFATITALLAAAGAPALAQSSPWSLHIGPAAVRLSVKTAPESPKGTPLPGASLSATNDTSPLALDIGYDVSPNWTGRLLIGVPAKSKVSGAGTLAPLGLGGELTYGPAALSASYTPGSFGGFKPYLGAGVAYLIALKSTDAGVANFNVKSAFGTLVTVGAEYALGAQYGLFVDVKKIFIKTEVTGNVTAFGGAPAYAKATVDPLVIHAGLNFRF